MSAEIGFFGVVFSYFFFLLLFSVVVCCWLLVVCCLIMDKIVYCGVFDHGICLAQGLSLNKNKREKRNTTRENNTQNPITQKESNFSFPSSLTPPLLLPFFSFFPFSPFFPFFPFFPFSSPSSSSSHSFHRRRFYCGNSTGFVG